ncbi:putative RNA-directed DNA polymerase from transposon BS [Labeo rohita]|uniref:RNA-directed DNA polymerase from transposon BS n=1 Tax=Labeo rohita TaxID=84645 RepID=A0ABQ8KZ95_LABRO|nr:putative RNA-directed DNA polymerase from transposon BS [Labeo rohita]
MSNGVFCLSAVGKRGSPAARHVQENPFIDVQILNCISTSKGRRSPTSRYRTGFARRVEARNRLTKEIRVAKKNYSEKLKKELSANNPTSVWTGLKNITMYKKPPPHSVENQQLADKLNVFYCRFEKPRLTPDSCSDLHFTHSPTTPETSLPHHSTCARVPKKPKITGLNDYRPVALTSVVMKAFEKLVLAYLKDITGPLLDSFQFAYRANRSVDDTVNMALHYILQHLDRTGNYARILFVDFSSAFNTIMPDLLSDKPPSGCVLSPLLFSLYTNDCTSKDPSVKLLKFADITTVIGLIKDRDNGADHRPQEEPPALPPLTIMDCTVATVESFRFLGTNISQDLKWDNHIDSIVKKAQQRLYFLRQLRKFNLPQELLKQFYSAIIESVLCSSISVWFGSATKTDIRRLQRTVRAAERIIGIPLPNLHDLYTSRGLDNETETLANIVLEVSWICLHSLVAYLH